MKIPILNFSLLAAFLLIYGNATGQSTDEAGIGTSGSATGIKAAHASTAENQRTSEKNKLHPASGRGCTPGYRSNPYAISRKNFEQLPPDRQKFILSNPDKYPITD